ncbi:acyl-CoA N-acyltransferase [Apiosordaria backusii]|uniref:Acyl-CoA N-acyltransferase n=1 Tax=Apiosordaria backusii TaxID=314023 RepID=A0AA40BRZ9_9PEZI|nr:acyl-CoA N-acyltransferase [Apiosordaria backusii]
MSITIRRAGPDDVDAIVEISMLVAPHTTTVPYIWPETDFDEYASWLYEHYNECLEDTSADQFTVMVAEAPDDAAIDKAEQDIFVTRYGEKQIVLEEMSTSPTYWCRGAGTRLLLWGMQRAREQGKVITVIADWMGKKLYKKLGFEELDTIVVQVEGEKEKVVVSAMVWDPREEDYN